jgi:hypothetical protein
MASRVFCIGNGESRRDFNLQNLRKHGKIYGCNGLYRDFTPDVLCSVDHGMMHEVYHAGVAQKIPCFFRDWTKVPAMHYETMVNGGLSEVEAKEHLDDILVSNERGDSDQFVMHGANLKGIVEMIKRNGEKYKKNVNNSTIKVSWIKKPDMSSSLMDIMVNEFGDKKTPKDHGWSCGPTSGYVAVKQETPKEIFLIGHDLYSATNKVNNMYKGTKHYVTPEHQPTPCVNWIRQWYTLFQWFPEVKFYKVNQFNDGRDAVNSPIVEWENNKKLPNVEYISYSKLDNMLQM